MSFTSYGEVGECNYCNKKAEVIFFRKGLFGGTNLRFFCKSCAKLHSRVRDDINSNHI